jgi:transaldolase / glucose-6-phosphate isomerase
MIGAQSMALPPMLARDVAAAVAEWDRSDKVRRLWARDAGLWTGGAEAG